jgi:lipoprotein-anchoring transpeptidase ErfK/SrfK
MRVAGALFAGVIALLAGPVLADGQSAQNPAPTQNPAPAPAPAQNPTQAPAPAPASTPANAPASPEPSHATLDIVNAAKLSDTAPKGGVSPAILRAEVMLDRVNVSPGVIDGQDGNNFKDALATYAKSRNLKGHGLDQKVWDSLLKESPGPVLVIHTLSDKDVEGPFAPDIPKDYAKQAEMKRLAYRSPAQKLGAMFHMSERLLAALNPGVDLGKAGGKILVTDVTAAPIHGTAKSVVVDKHKGQVLAYDRRGHVLAAFPATIGSRELPSPSGSYKVKGIAYDPIYYYDPDKNFVQGDNHQKLKLPPGPNNPVGSVFIALTKPTYGLHGTPDPDKIDKTASHGCVRMTNWDANELAHLVKRGIVVHFKS